MIAKNYIRFPEALRFQCEMFSNGYKNSPRIMRLMTVLFDWRVETPQWLKDAQARAKALVKIWKKSMIAFNFSQDEKPMRFSKIGYVHGNGPNGKTPKFEALLATGRTWESIENDDKYFQDSP